MLGQTFAVDAKVFVSGTSERSANRCFRLQATVAEPVVSHASGGIYSISSGFRALPYATAQDDIFFSGFEGCAK